MKDSSIPPFLKSVNAARLRQIEAQLQSLGNPAEPRSNEKQPLADPCRDEHAVEPPPPPVFSAGDEAAP